MAEPDGLPKELTLQLDQAGSVDLIVALPPRITLESQRETLAAMNPSLPVNTLFACADGDDLGEHSRVVRYPLAAADRLLSPTPGMPASFPLLLQICRKSTAKACCFWNWRCNPPCSLAIDQLSCPVRQEGFDLSLPNYRHTKLGSLVNRAIIHPLTRVLYGSWIHFPMATDFCLSDRMVRYLLGSDPVARLPRWNHWLTSGAIRDGMALCESHLAVDPPPATDTTDLSTALAAILDRLFSDMERNAAWWQRSNSPPRIPIFGNPVNVTEDEQQANVEPMIETFNLGFRSLAEIWGIVLPPATLLELKRLTRVTSANFRLNDDVWARIVYDFSIAFRQRTINREHLLRAATPLYLAWVASYVLKWAPITGTAENDEQALAFERQKSYLVSRWRWPDRFSP